MLSYVRNVVPQLYARRGRNQHPGSSLSPPEWLHWSRLVHAQSLRARCAVQAGLDCFQLPRGALRGQFSQRTRLFGAHELRNECVGGRCWPPSLLSVCTAL